jgi:hypothetical protein
MTEKIEASYPQQQGQTIIAAATIWPVIDNSTTPRRSVI